MSLRGRIMLSAAPEFFTTPGKQPVMLARVDDPAITAADFRNFLLVVLAIMYLGFKLSERCIFLKVNLRRLFVM
jgi:hypothetical protein